MKINLVDSIVNHIYDHLGLTSKSKTSLISDQFLLKDTFEYLDEHGHDSHGKIYGCQVVIDSSKFKLMAVDFSENDSEFALIVKLENCPTYGCYLLIDSATGDPDEGLIGFAIKPNNWLKTSVSLQGTFLAGMESLKDITSAWTKLNKYNDLVEEMKSFVKFRDNFIG